MLCYLSYSYLLIQVYVYAYMYLFDFRDNVLQYENDKITHQIKKEQNFH